MADQLPSALDPVSGEDWTVLEFLQAVRSDLLDARSDMVGVKDDLSKIRDDVAEVQADVNEIKDLLDDETEPPEPDGPITVTATVLGYSEIRADWETERTDLLGWEVTCTGATDNFSSGELGSEVRTYTFDELRDDASYNVALIPIGAEGPESEVFADQVATPGYPIIFTATALDDDSVRLDWETVRDDITNWTVAVDNGAPVQLASTFRHYVFTGLDAETFYIFTLVPFVEETVNLPALTAEATTPEPITISATVLGPTSIRVDWVTDRTDITSWTINYAGETDPSVGAEVRTYTFTGLEPDSTYALRVIPITAEGPLTQLEVIATTEEEEPEPPADVTMTAVGINTEEIFVEWETTRTDITGWTVGRDGFDNNEGGPWTTPTLGASTREFTFEILLPDTEYTITLTPITAGGNRPAVIETAFTLDEDPEPDPDETSAAVLLGWGTPDPDYSDEFDYTGAPDPDKWENAPDEGMPGHNGNGRRVGGCTTVANSVMTLHGLSNGDTGWVASQNTVQYGRWEVRSRSFNVGSSGGLYHVLHLIWPVPDAWPSLGEYDWLEYTNPDQQSAEAFLHYPHPNMPVEQEYASESGVDMTEFHNFAFQWDEDGLTGWIDGVEFFHFADGAGPNGRSDIQDMPNGRYIAQLDNFTGDGGLREAKFEIDFVRFYPLD